MKALWAFGSLAVCLGILGPAWAADPVLVSGKQYYPAYPQQQPCCPPGGVPGILPGVPVMPAMPSVPAAPSTLPGTMPPSAPGTTPPSAPGTTPPSAPGTTPPSAPGTTPPAAPGAGAGSGDQGQNPLATGDQGMGDQGNNFAQAPLAGTGGGGSNPNMIGDLGAASYICGIVSFRETQTYDVVTVIPASTGTNGVTRTVRTQRTVTHVSTKKTLIPQVGRGAVKIADNESPRPMDRAFITYNFFDNVLVPGVQGFDLHREVIGFEKTFLDGNASIGLRLNVLQATGNGDGSLNSSDFGDTTIITKYAFINDRMTGNVVSGGLAITVPTGPDAILPDGSRINSTLFQPFGGYIYNMGRLFAQGFTSLIIPSNGSDVTLLTLSNGISYNLYQANQYGGGMLTYVTPSLEGHATIPLNHRGLDSGNVGFPDLFVFTSGLHFGLGQSTDLLVALAVPVTGPKVYDVEAAVQLNYRFGASRGVNRPGYTPTLIGSY
ncbi:MAG: hypothetical protein U0746_01315 [Gemmataceae bacterium]